MSSRVQKDYQHPVYDCTFTIAKNGVANQAKVVVTVKDKAGNTVGEMQPVLFWLSDDVNGNGLTSTAPSVDLTVTTGKGKLLQSLTSKKCFIGLTAADGTMTVIIEDAVTIAYYCAASPLNGGFVSASRVLAAGDYGV